MKSVRIRSFSGPYFPAFGLNTDRKTRARRRPLTQCKFKATRTTDATSPNDHINTNIPEFSIHQVQRML